MRFEFDSDTDKTGWLFSLNYIDVVRSVNVGVQDSTLPTEFALEQNYPNPFNPTTTISFALPQARDITLTVYDVLGREVRELVSGRTPAGVHTISFGATDLPSGVYFYRLEAGDYVETREMVLLR